MNVRGAPAGPTCRDQQAAVGRKRQAIDGGLALFQGRQLLAGNGSQNLSIFSSLPLTSNGPTGENATARTGLACGADDLPLHPAAHVPKLDRAVPATGGEHAAIG